MNNLFVSVFISSETFANVALSISNCCKLNRSCFSVAIHWSEATNVNIFVFVQELNQQQIFRAYVVDHP
jgi:hypothetical protein